MSFNFVVLSKDCFGFCGLLNFHVDIRNKLVSLYQVILLGMQNFVSSASGLNFMCVPQCFSLLRWGRKREWARAGNFLTPTARANWMGYFSILSLVSV